MGSDIKEKKNVNTSYRFMILYQEINGIGWGGTCVVANPSMYNVYCGHANDKLFMYLDLARIESEAESV